MNDELKKKVYDLKEITDEALNAVKSENYEELNFCMEKRESIVDDILKFSNYKKEFKTEYDKLNIMDIEIRLADEINQKKDNIKKEISITFKGINVNRNYNSSIQKKAVIFSKKV